MAADRVRDEAERLVAAAIATVSSAARSFGTGNRTGGGMATGSAECCVCPVCRAIAAMRDPSGDLAERLASGVGDLATAASSILRTLATRGGRPTEPEPEPAPTAEGDEFWESLRRRAADAAKSYGRADATAERAASTVDDDPWRVATSADAAAAGPSPDVPHQGAAPEPAATPAPAKRVVKKAVKKAAPPVEPAPAPPVEPAPTKKVAKKAVAKKAVKKAAPPAG